MKEDNMKSRNVVNGMLVVLLLLMAGCATMQSAGHEYIMRGQVLEVAGDSAYLCIGSHDGAKVGQEFTVYRFERTPVSGKSHIPNFKRETIGKIRIIEIVDEHMATAKVLTGRVAANDVAELNP
jgi:hypothetical protein